MKMKQILKYSLISATLLSAYEANAWNPFAKKKDASPEEKMRKDAEILFPGMTMGCTSKLAQPFNPMGLARYLGEELKLVVSEKDIKKKQVAMKGVQRVMDYVKKLDRCSLNPKDKNFNKTVASKFTAQPGQGNKCNAPSSITTSPTSGKFGKFDVSQIYRNYVDSVYNYHDNKSLCSKVMATNKEVGKIQRIAELNKELGIPSGIKAKAMYLGFSQDLTKPLAGSGVAKKMWQLYNLDQQGFIQHFNRLLKGITSSNGKTTNPKAVDHLAQGCKGELRAVKIPLVQQLCQQALKTDAQNENNTKVIQWKRDLGVPGNAASAFAHYKIFDTSLVKNWTQPDAAEKLVSWYHIDSKGALNHLNMILKGVKGDGKKTLNPNSTKFVVEACNGEMNERVQIEIPVMKEICMAARKTHSTNDFNTEVAGYKKELGIGAVSSLMLKTCSPKFLQKLDHEVASKWAAVDPSGVKEYLENIAKCFKGQAVKNPKMAHYIEEKCNAGLATVPGAEKLCGKAFSKVQQFNEEASEELMKGMEGMVDEGSMEEQNPFAQTNENQNLGDFDQDSNAFGENHTVNFGKNYNDEEMSPLFTDEPGDMQGMFADDSDGNSFGNHQDMFGSFESFESDATHAHKPRLSPHAEPWSPGLESVESFESDATHAHQLGLNPHAEPWSPREGANEWGADNDFGHAQHAQSAGW